MHPDIITKFKLERLDTFLPEMYNAYQYSKDVFMVKMPFGERKGMIKVRFIENGNYHDTYFTEEMMLDMPVEFLNKIIKKEQADLHL